MYNQKFSQFFKQEFHSEFSNLAFETGKLLINFCEDNSREAVFIDATNFPETIFDVLSLKEISQKITEEDFETFLESQKNKGDRNVIYYYFGKGLHYKYLNPSYFAEYVYDEIDAPEEVGNFVLAYKNGIIKELYNYADTSGNSAVFALIDGEIKTFRGEEIFNFFETDGAGYIDFEHWSEVCIENTDSLVSYLFIDNRKNRLWYGTLNADFEQTLKESLGYNAELEEEGEEDDGNGDDKAKI